MPIPVPVPSGAYVIDDATNALAEALVAALAQIFRHGTAGAAVNTPATLYPAGTDPTIDSGTGKPVLEALSIETPEQQLYYRQLAVAFFSTIAVGGGALSGSVNPGPNLVPKADGTGKLLPGWLPPVLQQSFASTGVTKGRGIYISAANTVSQGANDADLHAAIIGVAAEDAAIGQSVTATLFGKIAGVLAGAAAGAEYFLGPAGQPVLFDVLAPGQRIVRLGYALSTTDLEVRIMDLGLR